jgi:archaeosine-15-forming tRNA-guanine transglycosylase
MELSYDGILSIKISHSLREVVSICNRAIHGEEIRKQDVEIIIHIGVELLNFLYTETPNIITKETEEIIIDNKNVDEYMSAKYKVTTVVPLVEKPKKKIYILNQQELDEFFDGYNEFAEFIVDIKKIEESNIS